MQSLSVSTSQRSLFDEISQTTQVLPILEEKVQSIAGSIFSFFNSFPMFVSAISGAMIFCVEVLYSKEKNQRIEGYTPFLIYTLLPFALYGITVAIKAISNFGRGKAKENLEDCSWDPNKPPSNLNAPLFETVQLRALASLEIDTDVEKVEKQLCALLTNCPHQKIHFAHEKEFLNKTLNKFTDAQIKGSLAYFGVTLNDKEWATLIEKGKVSDLLNVIVDNKQHGMFPRQYYPCMTKVLSNFLDLQNKSFSEKQKALLKNFSEQTLECYRLAQTKWTALNLKFYYHQKGQNNSKYKEDLLKTIKEFAKNTADAVDKQSNEEMGYLFEGGWAGHFIQTEIKKEGNKYLIDVANAGNGVIKYHQSGNAWNLFGHPEYITTKTFEVENREKLIQVLETLITAKTRRVHVYFTGAEEYYSAFNGLKERVYSDAVARPVQRVGNCGFRNQEELLFAILQKNGETNLANKIQQHIVNLYQTYPHMYVALKHSIQKQKSDVYTSELKPKVEAVNYKKYSLDTFHASTNLRRYYNNEI